MKRCMRKDRGIDREKRQKESWKKDKKGVDREKLEW